MKLRDLESVLYYVKKIKSLQEQIAILENELEHFGWGFYANIDNFSVEKITLSYDEIKAICSRLKTELEQRRKELKDLGVEE